jgi:hypothetical protein
MSARSQADADLNQTIAVLELAKEMLIAYANPT